jgi:ankyrin repeat protein
MEGSSEAAAQEGRAELESMDKSSQTRISRAAEKGHEEIVTLRLGKGAGIDSKDSKGQTLMSRAAQKGHEEVVLLIASLTPNLYSIVIHSLRYVNSHSNLAAIVC